MKVVPAARIKLKKTVRGVKEKRENHRQSFQAKPTLEEIVKTKLEDPIFTEDESEDEDLKNRVDSIVDSISMNVINSQCGVVSNAVPELTLIDSYLSSCSSPSTSDSDCSDDTLAIIAAKLPSRKRQLSSVESDVAKLKLLQQDAVIMSKKVIDYMKFVEPNGCKTSYRKKHNITERSVPVPVVSNTFLPTKQITTKQITNRSRKSSKMSRQASMELHSDPDISSSIKAKAQKMSKVNPKKRWLNGIDHLLNIVQNPEKTKTRLPGSHILSQIITDTISDTKMHTTKERCIEDCYVFKLSENSQWRPVDSKKRRANLTVHKTAISINIGNTNIHKVTLNKDTVMERTSSKFLQLNSSTSVYGFGFFSENSCRRLQEVLETVTKAKTTELYSRIVPENIKLLAEACTVNQQIAAKDKTIEELNNRLKKLDAEKKLALINASELEKEKNTLASKNDALEREVAKMRNLLYEASQELKSQEKKHKKQKSLHLIPILKEAKLRMEELVNQLGLNDDPTKTEPITEILNSDEDD